MASSRTHLTKESLNWQGTNVEKGFFFNAFILNETVCLLQSPIEFTDANLDKNEAHEVCIYRGILCCQAAHPNLK